MYIQRKPAPPGYHWETCDDGSLHGYQVLVRDNSGPPHPQHSDRFARPGHHWEHVDDGSLTEYYEEVLD